MTWGRGDPDGFVSRLAAAVEMYDRPAAAATVDDVLAHLAAADDPFPVDQTVRLLRLLRRKRFFHLMVRLAEGVLRAGQRAPRIRCEYAQALIDLGMPAATEDLLGAVLREADGRIEVAEARGMLGRAYKQMYVDGGGRHAELLEKAVAVYLGAYQEDPASCGWHGINAAALMCRARADGITVRFPAAPEAIAAEVLARAEDRMLDPDAGPGSWEPALAAEACLVLGRHDDAVRWTHRYAADVRADAFELGSTLRQATQVWRLDTDSEPGRRMLPILRSEMLGRGQGARVEIGPGDLGPGAAGDDPGLEKVLGRSGVVTLTWYRTGLLRSRAVARISHAAGRAVGTGFLVRAGEVMGGTSEAVVLVTNAHVVAPDPASSGALRPEQAVATFEVVDREDGGPAALHPGEVLFSSPPADLDVTVMTLAEPVPDLEPCPLTPVRPRLDGRQRVYVVGHPEGRELSYSIDDNVLLDYDDRVLHYRAPTEHGSSGSPVFNRDWEVIALHHAGRADMNRLHDEPGTYPANEGIWVEAIRRATAPS